MHKQFSSIAAVVVASLAGILVLGAFTAANINAQANLPANTTL